MAKTKTARKPRKKPQALAPRTTPGDPEQSGYRGVLYQPRTAGVIVNEDTGMTQSAVWGCVRCVSESLAGMPWLTGEREPDGTVEPVFREGFDWLMNYQANPETTSFVFRETLWAWALTWGNGYAEIERTLAGEPVALWQLHPCRVTPMRDAGDNLVYRVTNDGYEPSYIPARNMFHLMGPSPDGLVGWSVIRMHARTIGLAIAQEQTAATLNENDSTPGGILTHPKQLSDTARKNLEESWNRQHRGPNNRRRLAILEEDMKWQQTGLPPEDMQLAEQMQLTPAMVCRIFRVPPHKIGAGISNSSGTYSNNENQDIEFVKDCLRPWAERGESEADIKLFGRNNQARIVTFIDLSERERGDTAARTNHVERMTFCGIYSINEGRKYLGLPGIGPDGDKRFVQSAMIPIDQAGQDQTPPEDSTDEPTNDAPTMDEEDTLSAVRDKAMTVLVDACRRMLKREHGQREQVGRFPDEWIERHREYSREVITPAAAVFAACLQANPQAVDVAVTLFLASHKVGEEVLPEIKATSLRDYLTAAANAKEAA